MKMIRKFMVVAILAVALLSFVGMVVHAEDAPAAPAVAADVEEDEPELTYQQQASALIDTVIEDYTVRMAALQAIIDMRDDSIAGLNDNIKKLNDNIKLLTAVMKAGQNVDKNLRPIFVAMPDGDAKTAGIDYLDRMMAAVQKYTDAQ